MTRLKDLNTSYVMVHQQGGIKDLVATLFKYILCYGSSTLKMDIMLHMLIFKYILCYGSSFAGTQLLPMAVDLNTSYVMVHQIDLLGKYDVAVFKYILCYGSSMLWD